MGPQAGRVLLCKIVEEAAEQFPFKTSIIAEQLAELWNGLPHDNPIHEPYVSTVLTGNPSGLITAGALAAYFHAVSQGNKPSIVSTTAGPVPASAVTLARVWAMKRVGEAVDRAAFAAGYVQADNDAPSAAAAVAANASPIPCQVDQPSPPTGSEPVFLKLYAAKLRGEGEHKASEQAEELRIALQRAKQCVAEKEAVIATLTARLQLSQEEAESQRRGRIESERAQTLLMEQLHQHTGIIQFMNPGNPFSPVEGRRLVAAWDELTEGGTIDPVTEKGVGVAELARRWWADRFGEPSAIIVKHLSWALTWPNRKKGGMVARRK